MGNKKSIWSSLKSLESETCRGQGGRSGRRKKLTRKIVWSRHTYIAAKSNHKGLNSNRLGQISFLLYIAKQQLCVEEPYVHLVLVHGSYGRQGVR